MSSKEQYRALEAHKRWLGYLQPDGLVVSAAALIDKGIIYNEAQAPRQKEFIEHLLESQTFDEELGELEIHDFKKFCTAFLGWPESEWVEAADLPESYHKFIKECGETLSPWAALHLPRSLRAKLSENQSPYQLLIMKTSHPEGDFDAAHEKVAFTWNTSDTRRLERLLRETGVPIGLLISHQALRLVYAPQGENSGHLTFKFADMLSTMGRPILGALDLLLGKTRLFLGDEKIQLPALKS